MRIILLVLLVSFGAAAPGAPQGAPNAPTTPSGQEKEVPPGLLSEPHVVTQAVDLAGRWIGGDGSPAKDGLYPDLGDIATGAGWISAGPGYRRHFLNQRVLVDGSAAISWRAYKRAQARVELTDPASKHVTAGVQVRWQDLTQVNYFGIGPHSLESQRSEYRLKSTDVIGYGVVRPNDWLSVGGRLGWLKQPTISSPSGPFDRNFPDAQQVFPADPGISQQSDYIEGEVSITADTRDFAGHPTRGGVYRTALGTYSARELDQFSFRRYEAEALQVVPIIGKTWVLALHGWGVFSDTSAGHTVPFYLLPSLGGGNTLRSYHDYRFHDRNLLLANVESRWALFSHVDAAAFIDAGDVAPRAGDLNLDKRSYGGGLRVHTAASTLVRLDVAHGSEGWRIFVKLSDPFRLARRSLLASLTPFIP
jgi:hypothetical protein